MSWYTFLIISHVIGTALGAGGATISDFLFLKTLKDGRIDKSKFEFLKVVSSLVWTGFFILIFSGFGFLILYRLTRPAEGLIYDAKLFAKITIVLIIFFNGLVLHRKVMPLIESRLNKPLISPEFIKKAGTVFSAGAISIISWYSALILGAWRNLQYSYFEILGVYFGIIIVGIIVSNIFGRYLFKKYK